MIEKVLIFAPLIQKLCLQNRRLGGQRHDHIRGIVRRRAAAGSINFGLAIKLLVGEKCVGVVETYVAICAVSRAVWRNDRRRGALNVNDAGGWRVYAKSLAGRRNFRRCQVKLRHGLSRLWRVRLQHGRRRVVFVFNLDFDDVFRDERRLINHLVNVILLRCLIVGCVFRLHFDCAVKVQQGFISISDAVSHSVVATYFASTIIFPSTLPFCITTSFTGDRANFECFITLIFP